MSGAQSHHRLSQRQIATLKHLAVCCGHGGLVTLTRDQREAMLPLWRGGTVEMFFRHAPDAPSSRGPFWRPSAQGWRLIEAILAAQMPAPRVAA